MLENWVKCYEVAGQLGALLNPCVWVGCERGECSTFTGGLGIGNGYVIEANLPRDQ